MPINIPRTDGCPRTISYTLLVVQRDHSKLQYVDRVECEEGIEPLTVLVH